MFRRIVLIHSSFCSKQASHVLSACKNRIAPAASYHSDSIEGHVPDEPVYEEQRLSSHEATKILRTHEACVDLEKNCPVKYYDVNYLGANNPPGMWPLLRNRHPHECF